MSAERRCEICGTLAPALLFEKNGFSIVRCNGCGLIYVGDVPDAEELTRLYDLGYWEDPAGPGYGGYEAAEGRKRHHFRTLIDELDRLRAPGDLLDVGSAYGFFLDEARTCGWRVCGVEPSEHARAHAIDRLGLHVLPGPLVDLAPQPESLDAVTLWDVVEHLPDPRRTLECVYARLRPGGVLAVSTGDVGSVTARLHGRDWSLMTPPWHQFYFSRRTLRLLLEDIGFAVIRTTGDGLVGVDPQSPRPRIRGQLSALLTHPSVTAAGRRLRAGGIMFAFARKP